MGRTACTEPQCLYKGDLYLYPPNRGERRCLVAVVLILQIHNQRIVPFVSVQCRTLAKGCHLTKRVEV